MKSFQSSIFFFSNEFSVHFRAIASSAPVFWFPETAVPEDIYDRIVKRSFVEAGCNAKVVRYAWTALENLGKTGMKMVFFVSCLNAIS